jgi:hypothetical protein
MHQSGDCIERVEEKMRLKLHFEPSTRAANSLPDDHVPAIAGKKQRVRNADNPAR